MEDEQKQPTLRSGSKVFLPGHGVAQVVGREERDFGDDRQVFFVFRLSSGSKLLVPSTRLEGTGMRKLMSPGVARDLLRRVAEEPSEGPIRADASSRKKRAASHADALLDGSTSGYMNVLLELLSIARAGKLSAGEKRTLEAVRRFFLDEVAATLRLSPGELEQTCPI